MFFLKSNEVFPDVLEQAKDGVKQAGGIIGQVKL